MKRIIISLTLLILILVLGILIAQEHKNVRENFPLEIIPMYLLDGTVDFQVRTISYNGAYAPAHCLAIWVCDENDNFIRTIVRRAWSYRQHLVKWNQMTNGDFTNALITGASPNVHTTWTFNWDCKDRFDQTIPDGNYRVYVEFTEDNSLLIPVNGPWTVVEFTKGDQPQTVTPSGDQFFQDLYLEFNPTGEQIPSIEITSPIDGEEIMTLPFVLLFELENFPPDEGTINLFINNESINQHHGETGIPIYVLPIGEVEITLKLLDSQGLPFDPPVEDTINVYYNPANTPDNNITTVTKLNNYPNPFNPSTNIYFTITDPTDVLIEIYNMKGQKVKTLVDRKYQAGRYFTTWNGTDSNNETITSGIYFYQLTSDHQNEMKKCILMK